MIRDVVSARTAASELARLMDFVSPRCGIIRDVSRTARGVDEPVPPVLYHAQLSHFDSRKGTPIERMGAGKGMTDAEAIGGAIGEAIERYCASHVDLVGVERAPVGDTSRAAVQPAECVLYSASQYARPDFPY